MSSPTTRTLAWLRDRGYTCAITEKFNAYTKQRNDAFGFIDVIAISANWTIGVQATSGANVAARITKVQSLETSLAWLSQPSRRIWVIGWRKMGKAGTRKLWQIRIVELRHEQSEWSQEELLASEFPRTASGKRVKTSSHSTAARTTSSRGSGSNGPENNSLLIDATNCASTPSPSGS